MIFEEKILAYLDGTLDANDRAELLHTLSVSPEKREMLEEHLRLRELMAFGHKPLDVPATVERIIAERIPALAPELVHEDEEVFAFAEAAGGVGFFSSMAHVIGMFFSPMSVRFAAAALVLIGGLWVTLANRPSAIQIAANDNSRSVPSANGAGRSSSVALGGSTVDSREMAISRSAAPIGRSSQTANQIAATDHSIRSSALRSGPQVIRRADASQKPQGADMPDASIAQNVDVPATDRVHLSTKSASNVATAVGQTPSNGSPRIAVATPVVPSNDVNAATPLVPDHVAIPDQVATNESNPTAGPITKEPQNTNPTADQLPGPTAIKKASTNDKASATVVDPSQPAALSSTKTGSMKDLPIRFDGDDYGDETPTHKFTLTCFYGLSKNFNPELSSGPSAAANPLRSIGTIALDYRLVPNLWLGMEVGQNFFSQIATTAQVSLLADQVAMYHVNYTSQIQTIGVPWLRAALRYTFWSNSTFSLRTDLGAGTSFASGPAPLFALGGTLRYNVDSHMGLTAGARYTGAWIAAQPMPDWRSAIPSAHQAVGIIVDGAANRTLFTPVVDFLFGLQYQL